jgi:hypothetical protein
MSPVGRAQGDEQARDRAGRRRPPVGKHALAVQQGLGQPIRLKRQLDRRLSQAANTEVRARDAMSNVVRRCDRTEPERLRIVAAPRRSYRQP